MMTGMELQFAFALLDRYGLAGGLSVVLLLALREVNKWRLRRKAERLLQQDIERQLHACRRQLEELEQRLPRRKVRRDETKY
jgi:sensor domain CHASE-containing protein